jgi:hypothetical protein
MQLCEIRGIAKTRLSPFAQELGPQHTGSLPVPRLNLNQREAQQDLFNAWEHL